MKKTYESPKVEVCEFTVGARLLGSGRHVISGKLHDNSAAGQAAGCTKASDKQCLVYSE